MSKTLGLKAGRPTHQRQMDLADEEETPKKRVNFDLSAEDYKKLKIYCVEQDQTISQVLRSLVKKVVG